MKTTIDLYRNKIETLSNAGVGVIVTRTREAEKVCEAVELLALNKDRGFKSWTCVSGWKTIDNVTGEEQVDGAMEVNGALMKVGSEPFPSGFYVMMNTHHWLDKSPIALQLIQNYAREFSRNKVRLVLTVPDTFDIPHQIQDDVYVVDFENPTQEELKIVMEEIIPKDLHNNDKVFVNRVAAAGAGMSTSQFETAVSTAYVVDCEDGSKGITDKDKFLKTVMDTKIEVVKRSGVLEVMPTGNMGDIGGLEEFKDWLKARKCCYTEEAKAAGIEAPKGVFLSGAPGTGKSACGKAAAGELGLPLIRFDVGSVFNSLVGSSEARVRAALNIVKSLAPCVVLLDEIDKAGFSTSSSSGDSGVGKRIMGAILTFMQECNAPIFWMMTANRVQGLPPELFRKGRLDEIFAVLPPHAIEREEVLKIHIRKRGRNPEDVVGLDKAVECSDGFVSAELEAAVKEGLIIAYTRGEDFEGKHIIEALESTKPLSKAFPEDFAEIESWAVNHARLASRPPKAGGKVGDSEPRGTRRRRTIEA